MLALIACMLFLVLAVHPFVFYPLSLMLARRRWASIRLKSLNDPRKTVAVCLSAFNEERVIVAKVERLIEMAAAYGPATIHIYVDGGEDRTAELLEPYGEQIDIVVSPHRRGKTYGMNWLASRCDSEILVFTDANVVVPTDGLIKLTAPFDDQAIGCVSARLNYINPHETATSLAGAVYWRLEEAIKSIETNTVGVIGVDGAFFAIRREAHEPAPDHLIDDLYVSLCALVQGRRVISIDLEATERNASRYKEEFRRKARIACQAMNVHRALWPRLRRMPFLPLYGYISHRLLKWLMPFNLGAAATCVVFAAVERFGFWYLGATMIGVGLFTALGVWLKLKPVRLALSIVSSLGGVAMGVLQSIFWRAHYTSWTPAPSVRETDMATTGGGG